MDDAKYTRPTPPQATSHRRLHLLNAGLFAALWIFVIAGYAHLPDQVPQHMGLGGQVTRWTDRGMWFVVPIIMSTQAAILYGIAVSFTSASGMNVPHKERLMALPKPAQLYALEPVRTFLFAIVAGTIVLTIAIKIEFFIAARRGYGTATMLPAIGVLLLVLVAGMVWMSRHVRRRVEALERTLQRSEANPA